MRPVLAFIVLLAIVGAGVVGKAWQSAYTAEENMYQETENFYGLKHSLDKKPVSIHVDFTKPGWEKDWDVDPCLNLEQTNEGVIMSTKEECGGDGKGQILLQEFTAGSY